MITATPKMRAPLSNRTYLYRFPRINVQENTNKNPYTPLADCVVIQHKSPEPVLNLKDMEENDHSYPMIFRCGDLSVYGRNGNKEACFTSMPTCHQPFWTP